MKKIDENKLAAYINESLKPDEMAKMDEIIANDIELQKTILDVLNAKTREKTISDEELPWQLKSMMQDKIEQRFTSKAKLVLKLIKNGIEEISNTLNGERQKLAYDVRGAIAQAPVFNYIHSHEEVTFHIYTFYEDDDHIRIKLETKDNHGSPVNGTVSLKRIDDGVETKTTKMGTVEFENIMRGSYEFRFEYKDELNPRSKAKNIYLFLALD